MIKFKSKDIDMDLTVTRLMCNEKIPEDEDFLMHPTATVDLVNSAVNVDEENLAIIRSFKARHRCGSGQ